MITLLEQLMILGEKDSAGIASDIQDLIDVSVADPSTKKDDYMKGLGNGLAVAKSVVDGSEPNFVNMPEKERHFVTRTTKHIELVQKAIDMIATANPEFREFDGTELAEIGKWHDKSKFQEPERTPYISITWRHKLEKEKGEFDSYNGKGYQTPGLLAKEDENKATMYHILNNSHHPEYHLADKGDANIDAKDRDKSLKVVDASAMPALDIAEMVADWVAMSWELQSNTPRQWYDKQKDVRWHFSPEQDVLIDRLLKVFEVTDAGFIREDD